MIQVSEAQLHAAIAEALANLPTDWRERHHGCCVDCMDDMTWGTDDVQLHRLNDAKFLLDGGSFRDFLGQETT